MNEWNFTIENLVNSIKNLFLSCKLERFCFHHFQQQVERAYFTSYPIAHYWWCSLIFNKHLPTVIGKMYMKEFLLNLWVSSYYNYFSSIRVLSLPTLNFRLFIISQESSYLWLVFKRRTLELETLIQFSWLLKLEAD